MNTKTKKIIIAVVGLAVLVAVMLGVYFAFAPKAQSGEKQIGVEVVLVDGTQTDFSFKTKAENLRTALEEQSLISGTESDYGLFVTEVNGVTADASKQEWWCFTKGGETMNTGVDDTMISDGDKYEITLTQGY